MASNQFKKKQQAFRYCHSQNKLNKKSYSIPQIKENDENDFYIRRKSCHCCECGQISVKTQYLSQFGTTFINQHSHQVLLNSRRNGKNHLFPDIQFKKKSIWRTIQVANTFVKTAAKQSNGNEHKGIILPPIQKDEIDESSITSVSGINIVPKKQNNNYKKILMFNQNFHQQLKKNITSKIIKQFVQQNSYRSSKATSPENSILICNSVSISPRMQQYLKLQYTSPKINTSKQIEKVYASKLLRNCRFKSLIKT